MLRYFIERSDLKQVNYICKQLNEVKSRLYLNDFDNPQKELELCNTSFAEIFSIAEKENNEKLANSNYVFKCYFLLFSHLMSFFSLLQERSYKSSWSRLQDCIDDIQYIGKFAEDRLELPDNWKWVRFGEIGLFKKGPFGSALTKSMFVPKSDDTVKVYEQQHAIQKNSELGTYYIPESTLMTR